MKKVLFYLSILFFICTTTEAGYRVTGDLSVTGSTQIDGALSAGDVLYVTDGDNVGIGTTSPTAKLEISDTGTAKIDGNAGLGAGVNFYGDTTTHYGTTGNSSIVFSNQGGERIRILSGGNVGIGTTSPSNKLDVAGIIEISAPIAEIKITDTDAGNAFAIKNQGGTLQIIEDGDEHMVIKADGNVGIGTDTPTSKLEIAGDLSVSNSLIVDNDGAEITVDGLTTYTQQPHLLLKNTTDGDGVSSKKVLLGLQANGWSGGASQKVNWTIEGNGMTNGNPTLNIYCTEDGGSNNRIFSLDSYGGIENNINYYDYDQKENLTTKMSFYNNAAATSSYDQYSYWHRWSSAGWKTNATAGSQEMSLGYVNAPEQGAISPKGVHKVFYGIGTSTPTESNEIYRLTWGSNEGDLGVILNENSKNDFTFRVEGDADENLLVANGTLENVGIGTATPTAKLDVSGGAIVSNNLTIGDGNCALAEDADTLKFTTDSGATWTEIGTGTGGTSGVDGTGTASYITKWVDSDTVTDSIVYDSGTNVGIGTTSPEAILDIESASGGVIFITHTGQTNSFIGSNSNGDLMIGSGAWSTDNVQMTVQSDGNVGIGDWTPSATLEVNGDWILGSTLTQSGGNAYYKGTEIGTTGGSQNLQAVLEEGNTATTPISLSESLTATDVFISSAASPSGAVMFATIDNTTGQIGKSALPYPYSDGNSGGAGTVDGSGTANYITKWADGDTVSNSVAYDNGTNVGIGTTTPTSKLHIKSTVSGGSGDYSNVNGQLKIEGTGGLYWRMPHISGDTGISGIYNYETGKNIYWGENADTGQYVFRGRDVVVKSSNVGIGATSPSALVDIVPPSGWTFDDILAINTLTANDSITIRYDGRIGVGTTDPFRGQIEVKQKDDNSFGGITLTDSGLTGSLNVYVAPTAGGGRIEAGSTGTGTIGINTGGGHVGIGTTSPESQLDVSGDVKVSSRLTIGDGNCAFAEDSDVLKYTTTSGTYWAEIGGSSSGSSVGVGVFEDAGTYLTSIESVSPDLSLSRNLTVNGIVFGGASNFAQGLDISFVSTTSVKIGRGLLVVNNTLVEVPEQVHTIVNYEAGHDVIFLIDKNGSISDTTHGVIRRWDGSAYDSTQLLRYIGGLYCDSDTTILEFDRYPNGEVVFHTPIVIVDGGDPDGAYHDFANTELPSMKTHVLADCWSIDSTSNAKVNLTGNNRRYDEFTNFAGAGAYSVITAWVGVSPTGHIAYRAEDNDNNGGVYVNILGFKDKIK